MAGNRCGTWIICARTCAKRAYPSEFGGSRSQGFPRHSEALTAWRSRVSSLPPRPASAPGSQEARGRAGIHVNKNTVPGDPRSPFVTSGLRIGTPALTTRGMGEDEMVKIGDLITRVLALPDDETVQAVAAEVLELTENFPLYISAATT